MATHFPTPANEVQRLQALHDYNILDTFTEKEYDFITKMASQICNCPVSLITLLDEKRQFVKSNFGFPLEDMPRELSFCNYTILDATKVNMVSDMRLDERYSQNPLVTGVPNAVFYAGAPLVTPQGFVLGSICVLDAAPNTLTEEQQDNLKQLAVQTITTMELRKKNRDLEHTQKNLEVVNNNLKDFARSVSHDMRTPLGNIAMLSKMIKDDDESNLNEENNNNIDLIENCATQLISFVDKMLAKSEKNIGEIYIKKDMDTKEILEKIISLIAVPSDFKIEYKGNFPSINIDEIAFQQVFQNLITNAIKYNNKTNGHILIEYKNDNHQHFFSITDNGNGINEKDFDKIFSDNITLNITDRFGNKGTGIGLAKVKSIVASLNGCIDLFSKISVGSTFTVSLPISIYPTL